MLFRSKSLYLDDMRLFSLEYFFAQGSVEPKHANLTILCAFASVLNCKKTESKTFSYQMIIMACVPIYMQVVWTVQRSKCYICAPHTVIPEVTYEGHL